MVVGRLEECESSRSSLMPILMIERLNKGTKQVGLVNCKVNFKINFYLRSTGLEILYKERT